MQPLPGSEGGVGGENGYNRNENTSTKKKKGSICSLQLFTKLYNYEKRIRLQIERDYL
jgi:hypothetical protein